MQKDTVQNIVCNVDPEVMNYHTHAVKPSTGGL